MAESKRPKLHYTPRVGFIYPRLNQPDDKFNKLNPQYSVKFAADPKHPVIAEIVAELDAAAAEREQEARKAIAENKSLSPPKRKEALEGMKVSKGYEEQYDDNDQPTGLLVFKASTGSVFKDKKTGKPTTRRLTILNAKKVDITKSAPKIGGGSEGRLEVSVGSGILKGEPWAKLYLSCVQLLKLVEFGSHGAGFSDDEDGYDGEGDDDYGAGDERDTNDAGSEGSGGDDEL